MNVVGHIPGIYANETIGEGNVFDELNHLRQRYHVKVQDAEPQLCAHAGVELSSEIHAALRGPRASTCMEG